MSCRVLALAWAALTALSLIGSSPSRAEAVMAGGKGLDVYRQAHRVE